MAGFGLLADLLQGAVEAVDAPVPGGQGAVVHGGLQAGTGFFGRAEQGEVLHGRVEDDHGAARDIDDVIAGKAGGYTGSSGDQADLDFSIVAAMEQPAWSDSTSSAPMAETKTLSVLSGSSQEEQQGAFEFIKYFTNPENQVKWTMSTGYVAVNVNIDDNEEYQAYVAENPQAAVPFQQATHGTVYPYDPTNGAVKDALNVAADKVEIEGISAKEALDEAQATAQAALDEALGN